MQIKFEESNLRQVDVWLYSTSDTSIEFIDLSKNSLFWESKKKKQFKIQFSRLLRRRIFEPVGMDTKGCVSASLLRWKINKSYKILTKLRSFNENVVYGHFEINTLTTALNMVRKGFFIENIHPSNTCCWNTYCCFER